MEPKPQAWGPEIVAALERGLVYNRAALPAHLARIHPGTAFPGGWPICRTCGRAAPASAAPPVDAGAGPWPDVWGWTGWTDLPGTWDCGCRARAAGLERSEV